MKKLTNTRQTMNNLFCSYKQGRLLQEMLPKLQSAFVWVESDHKTVHRRNFAEKTGINYDPALTLHELRDVVRHHLDLDHDEALWYVDSFISLDAPELADWIIERLKETTT
jgi:hypothetical protein